MSEFPITVPDEFVAEFCRRSQIHRLSFFGSELTPRFRSESDIDILVEFEPEHVPGLFGVARMEREL